MDALMPLKYGLRNSEKSTEFGVTYFFLDRLPMAVHRPIGHLSRPCINERTILIHIEVVYRASLHASLQYLGQFRFLLLSWGPIRIERLGIFAPAHFLTGRLLVIAGCSGKNDMAIRILDPTRIDLLHRQIPVHIWEVLVDNHLVVDVNERPWR
jgi:hypothetical protein